MKYTQEDLSLENGLKKEWLITNGIGGFVSSTILGINTRKYHGLLIAPLTPPARRFLILSKVDESVETNGKKYNLYSNMGKDYVSDGFQYLLSFEKEYIPIYTYQVENILIKKFICMQYGKNTITILYRIQNHNSKTKLTLAPLINLRDFHTTNTNHEFDIKQEVENRKVKIIVDHEAKTPIYMNASDGRYVEHHRDTFYNMYYPVEEDRGFPAQENHAVPGVYEINLYPNEERDLTFVCSLEENIEEIDAIDVINKEIMRLSGLLYDSGLADEKRHTITPSYKDLMKNYIIAADNFVVYRPSFNLHTVIAGYPWFLDWGRDTLLSFEGLLLLPKRYDIAKEVLLTSIRDIKFGLVPNGYSGFDNRPLYNSVDSSLLLFEQIYKYLNYTQDYEFVKNQLYEVLVKIIDAYCHRIDVDDNNIYLDQDYLISSGDDNTQNTWMDAKVNNVAVTPRNGKAVEINSMWYNALKIMEELTEEFSNRAEAKRYGELAQKCQKSFLQKFYHPTAHCLYDVLGDNKIRPNQLFALSLSHPVVDPSSKMAKEIFETVTDKLLTPYGLKTLSKGEEGYIEHYEGDGVKRDNSYHQGITWPWLLGPYYDSFKHLVEAEKSKVEKKELEERLNQFVSRIENTFIEEMTKRSTVGSISEIYDSAKPFEAKGAFAQAWSVAEIFRIIIKR